jgi:hypothetical protein
MRNKLNAIIPKGNVEIPKNSAATRKRKSFQDSDTKGSLLITQTAIQRQLIISRP